MQKEVCNFDLASVDNITYNDIQPGFSRIGYQLELAHPTYGFQHIYTEFQAFSQNISDYVVPNNNNVLLNIPINDLTITGNGETELHVQDGHIEFSSFNYSPLDHEYNTNDNLHIQKGIGNYGCMQIHRGNDVIWAFNCFHWSPEVGIGNNPNGHKDWTFTHNVGEYNIKLMKIFALYDTPKLEIPALINMRGIAHGDSPQWDALTQTWGITQIPFQSNSSNYLEPNLNELISLGDH